MSLRRSSLGRWAGVAAVAWAGLAAGNTRGEEKLASGPAPGVDEQKAPDVTINGARPGMRKNGLMRLEEDLARSLGGFRPGASLEEEAAPRKARPKLAPPAQNQRAKEQIDRRKNWVFTNPDDPVAGLTAEEMLNVPGYGPDGQEKKPVSSVERFYKYLEQRYSSKAAAKPPAENDPFNPRTPAGARNETGSPEEANPPGGVKDMAESLKRLLGTDSGSLTPFRTHGTVSDIFGLGEQRRSPEEEEAHKVSMDQYKRWLDGSMGTAGTKAAGTTVASDSPSAAAAYSSVPNVSIHPLQPVGPAPRLGIADPNLAIDKPQDASAKVLNQWNSLYVPPKVEPPKTATPPPAPEPPRRKF